VTELGVDAGAPALEPDLTRPLPRALRALAFRDFRRFWAGALGSSIGNNMQLAALGWVVAISTRSAAKVTLLAFVTVFPLLVLGPLGGALADRFPRRKLLLVTQTALMAQALALWIVWELDLASYWTLFGISLAGDNAFYFFCVAVVVLGVVAIETVRITRLGRLLRQVADSQTAVESLGINPTASRVLVFCLSAFLGGLGGALLGSLSGSIQPSSFDFTNSLIWVAVVVTAGTLSMGGAVLGAILFVVAPTMFDSGTVLEWQPVFFGVAAIVLAQTPNGIAGLIRMPNFGGLAAASRWRLERTPHDARVTA
jgi:ABC-type branched-subunit amino acid transport system permease subunit